MRARAFSLLETIVSACLLGLVVIFVLNLFPGSMATIRRSEQRFRAGTLAASVLEQQAAAAPATVKVGTATDLPSQTIDQITYAIHLSVTQFETDDPKNLKCLNVVVSWNYANQTFNVTRHLLIHRLTSNEVP
jgi:type II secretory pathway pseudopilin PulG